MRGTRGEEGKRKCTEGEGGGKGGGGREWRWGWRETMRVK